MRKDVRLVALECGAVGGAALCRRQRQVRVGRQRGWVHGGWVHAVEVSDLADAGADQDLDALSQRDTVRDRQGAGGRTARIGYMIHSANISMYSIISSVDTPLVASTVNPPARHTRAAHKSKTSSEHEANQNAPKSAQSPMSTRTHLPRSDKPARTTEYTMKMRCLTASSSAAGGRRVSDGLDKSTTVTAPTMASNIPSRSR